MYFATMNYLTLLLAVQISWRFIYSYNFYRKKPSMSIIKNPTTSMLVPNEDAKKNSFNFFK